jgi:hypothetical protein
MSTEQRPAQGHCCLACHFLEKWVRMQNDSSEYSLGNEERKTLGETGHLTEGSAGWSVACAQNVWDSANPGKEPSPKLRAMVLEERGETCFFYPYTPGMFFPAARELERREVERRERRRDRGLALWVGLGSAVIGTIIGAVVAAWLSSQGTSPAPDAPPSVQRIPSSTLP